MTIIWSARVDSILNRGQTLAQAGINNWALSKQDSFYVLDKFLEMQIPVLGGDVYEAFDEVLQSNYDSWYCNQMNEESRPDFVKRSIRVAREFIENYQMTNTSKIYFVLVPDEDLNP